MVKDTTNPEPTLLFKVGNNCEVIQIQLPDDSSGEFLPKKKSVKLALYI